MKRALVQVTTPCPGTDTGSKLPRTGSEHFVQVTSPPKPLKNGVISPVGSITNARGFGIESIEIGKIKSKKILATDPIQLHM